MYKLKLVLGLMLAGTVGVAAAGDLDTITAADYADSNDYSAKVFYSLNFGGTQGYAQSMGLRFDHERMAAFGAPAVFQVAFDGQGDLNALKLTGLDLRGPGYAAGATEGGLFAGYTTAQWVALGITGALFIAVAADVTGGESEPVTGTGTGGN